MSFGQTTDDASPSTQSLGIRPNGRTIPSRSCAEPHEYDPERDSEQRLKAADAMVVVLSANSVDKPWVREELNAGFLKRIEGKCKLISVVLDDVQVPGALRSTVWQRIADLDSYDEELDRIVRAIHDDRNRPAPGEPPGYAQTTSLPGLYSTDTLVCGLLGIWFLSPTGPS